MPSATSARNIDKGAEILDVRREVRQRRSNLAVAVDAAGALLASPLFFLGLVIVHVVWIALNLPVWPYEPWDPYPFTFLATLASVEAPFIALLVLMHQQRETHIAEVREDVDLQTTLHLEREVTTLIRLVRELQEKLGVQTKQDPEVLERQAQELDPEKLLKHVRQNLDQDEAESRATEI